MPSLDTNPIPREILFGIPISQSIHHHPSKEVKKNRTKTLTMTTRYQTHPRSSVQHHKQWSSPSSLGLGNDGSYPYATDRVAPRRIQRPLVHRLLRKIYVVISFVYECVGSFVRTHDTEIEKTSAFNIWQCRLVGLFETCRLPRWILGMNEKIWRSPYIQEFVS